MLNKKIFSLHNRVKSSFKKSNKVNEPFNYKILLTNHTNLSTANTIKHSDYNTITGDEKNKISNDAEQNQTKNEVQLQLHKK